MPRTDTRTYITIHDGIAAHPKVEGLSDAAFRLLIESWCYCSQYRTDGVIKAAAWARRGTAKARRELETAGLVEPHPEGVYCHDYTKHQRTSDEIDESRTKKVEAGRKGGLAKAAARQTPSEPLADARASATADAEQVLSTLPSKPLAMSVSVTETDKKQPSGGPSGRAAEPASSESQRLIGEWIDHCGERPPSRVVGHIAKEVSQLLRDGIPYDDVRTGLISWQAKGLHPSTLASEVHSTRTAVPRASTRQQQTDDIFTRAAQRNGLLPKGITA